MATPSDQIWGTIDTPNAEEVGAGHPMIWDAVNQRWIDVTAMQQQIDQTAQNGGQPMPSDVIPPNPQPAGFVMPSWGYWLIGGVVIVAVAGVGYYAYKKWK